MKKKRHEAILKLIKEFDIETQEELLIRLKESGFNVTQATISRDIKELGLVKSSSKYGGYKYISRKKDIKENVHKFISIFRESVLGVDYAGHTIVVKSYAGMANAACAAIDSMSHDEILGTIAGDDTIFILCRTEEIASSFTNKLRNMLNA